MSDYDYINTRIHAMSRFLLPNEVFQQILHAETEDVLIDVLLDSPYGPILSARLPEQGAGEGRGVEAAEAALRDGLFDTFAHIREIAVEEPRRLLRIQLNRWDVLNVIAVLRGVVKGVERESIVASMVPAGEIHPARLSELAAEQDPRSVADTLATWGFPFAQGVRRVVEELPPGASDLGDAEAKLYANYYSWAVGALNTSEGSEATLRGHLQLQIDLVNIIGVLKHVAYQSQKRPIADFEPVPHGKLRHDVLRSLQSAQSVEYALEVLDPTYFSEAVDRGVLIFGQTNRLSVLERFFEQVVIEKGMKLFRRDPLNIGVPLGFIWRKVNEYLNLRMLLRGRRYHLPTNAIREELLLV